MLPTNQQIPQNRTFELVETAKNRLTITRLEFVELVQRLGASLSKRVQFCAAKLLDVFRHQTENKLKFLQASGSNKEPWIYRKLRQIHKDELLGEYSIHTVRAAIAFLEKAGFIAVDRNKSDAQNRTHQYLLLKLPFQKPSPQTHTQSRFVRSESLGFRSETLDFTVETHNRSISTDCELTAAEAAVDLKFEENSNKEADGYQQDSLNDIQKAQEEALNHLEVVGNVEEDLKVVAGISGEDHSSPADCVNSIQSKPEVQASSNDVLSEVESLVGDEMSPQLERFILSQSVEVVKNAIAFVKEKLAKGQLVKKKAGYLIAAIRNQLKPTAPATTTVQTPKFPAGFEEWYAEATEKGQVAKVELRHLSISNGEPTVFVPSAGRSMRWYEAQAFLS